jgi:hypothetical protein
MCMHFVVYKEQLSLSCKHFGLFLTFEPRAVEMQALSLEPFNSKQVIFNPILANISPSL